LESGQGLPRTECPSLKAEVARADPQLVSQVHPMSLALCPWAWSISRSWCMLTVPLGGRRGRDVVEMPAERTRLHGTAGVVSRARAKEEVRYNGLQAWVWMLAQFVGGGLIH
jgi:hypothetical protein